jgi:hypothetical protein
MSQAKRNCVAASVADGHRFDADPDPTFHFDADQDPEVLAMSGHLFDIDRDPIFHFDADQDPDSDPTPSFTHNGKPEFFYFYSQQLFHLSCQG